MSNFYDILITLIFSALSFPLAYLLEMTVRKLFKINPDKYKVKETYSTKLAQLSENLVKSSKEVDKVLAELSQVTSDRENAVRKLEEELLELENRERQLQERIRVLENVPIPVVEHFAQLTLQGEQRSAKRDYFLFGAGVLVSTIIAIILRFIGLG